MGNDTIYGEAGNDTIAGEGGDDIVHGGTGADLFVTDALSFGSLTIGDFDVTIDRLMVLHTAPADRAGIIASLVYDDARGGTVMTVDPDTAIVLLGLHTADLAGGWLTLA